MAKRRRLTPPRADYLGPAPDPVPGLPRPGLAAAPISHVAGDASASAALREVADELASARAEGRLLLRLPLAAVDDGWLVRDRVTAEDAELDALIASLREHGQRSPVEVGETAPGRYGLISGWRRLTALRRLQAETGDPAFATVLALLRRPETAGDAYVAMVEENEIRVGLSYFERARIAAKAVEGGVFATEKVALQRLYANASRAKRSKIGSFLTICHALDGALRFPAALPERLGLTLSRALEADAGLAGRIRAALAAAPPADAVAEQALLARMLRPAAAPEAPAAEDPVIDPIDTATSAAEDIAPGLVLTLEEGRLVLSGPGVTPLLVDRLRDWLRAGGAAPDVSRAKHP